MDVYLFSKAELKSSNERMHSRVYAKLQNNSRGNLYLRHNQKSPSIPVSGAARNRAPVGQPPGDHEQVLIVDQSWTAKRWT